MIDRLRGNADGWKCRLKKGCVGRGDCTQAEGSGKGQGVMKTWVKGFFCRLATLRRSRG